MDQRRKRLRRGPAARKSKLIAQRIRALSMAATNSRPLSPHLTIWRWGPHMVVSILHRATGIALSIAGLALRTWWLSALAEGQGAYANFIRLASSPIGLVVLIGLTWSFFQHLLSGIRHLATDTGAAFEIRVNRTFAILTIVGSVLLTAALLLLGTWLIASLLLLPNLHRQTVLEWLHAPSGVVPMALFIVIGFRHALDGLKVV